ncbi:MAG: type II toxin-antitoxin system RelE/ParE family toxin [Chloroflexota bacterium]
MARRVAWTETAWRDLERIADYIAEDSPGYAAALVRRVRDGARSLEEMAERGRVVPELEEPAIRELVIGSYRLVYEIEDADIYILGLIHGARDLAALWEKEGRSGSGTG